MTNIKKVTLLIVFALSACESVKDVTIPLPVEFVENSELIELETPTWRVPSSVFDKSVGKYSIVNSSVSSTSSDEELVNVKREGNFLNYLLFDDDLHVVTREYNVESSQRFSFDVKSGEEKIVSSKCEIFSQERRDKTDSYEFDGGGHSAYRFEKRVNTYLICEINNQGSTSTLTLLSVPNKNLKVSFQGGNDLINIESISGAKSIIGEGVSPRVENMPPWASQNSGVEIFDESQTVAAVSFVGKSKLWMKKNLPPEKEELLVSIFYSLSMFNWLDKDWRQPVSRL